MSDEPEGPRRPENPGYYFTTFAVWKHPQGLTSNALKHLRSVLFEAGFGEVLQAGHDVVILNMVHQPDGSLVSDLQGHSHAGTEMTVEEYWRAWTTLTALLRRKLRMAGETDTGGSRLDLLETLWSIIVDKGLK